MADRITALDTIGINVIAIVAVLSMMLHTQAYLDIILLIGILAFLSTVAFARYIERGRYSKMKEIVNGTAEIAIGLIVLCGALLSALSAFGLIRLPDVYLRAHAATVQHSVCFAYSSEHFSSSGTSTTTLVHAYFWYCVCLYYRSGCRASECTRSLSDRRSTLGTERTG